MNNDRFLSMLGLCRRAGKLVIGVPMVAKEISEGKIKVVFVAADASQNAVKKTTDKCTFYNVECIKTDICADILAHAVGKSGPVCALGVTDGNFSKELTTLISYEKR